jgi:uncharacterized protein YdiU (UPF0061 family)
MSKPAAPPPDPIAGWHWDHSYTDLPELFFARSQPVPVREPRLAILNRPLAHALGLDPTILELPENAGIFTGNQIPAGAQPIAQAYAGHQFGHFTGLGDGRAILLGQQITAQGKRLDVQLKGAGRTPFSRGGDGRAALGPMLREYIISEAMHALGIPTTRSLAVAITGEDVVRAEVLSGAVLTRIAASHIRVGTFQHAAAHQDKAALQALADHTLQLHFPELLEKENRYFELFEAVMERQAALIAQWLHVGFIHGVMNTDNMALSGETIDYGPCAFMEVYHPDTVFSSIDRQARYAYGRQPEIARWNLARLAEAMLPLWGDDTKKAVDFANQALGGFEARFQAHWQAGMRAKLGLRGKENDDLPLIQSFLDWMESQKMDFTNSFRALSHESAVTTPPFTDPEFLAWHLRWSQRLAHQGASAQEIATWLRLHNPAVIPRNHKVEEALYAAEHAQDLSLTHRLLEALALPYETPVSEEYTSPAPHDAPAYQTFCGT